MKTGYNFNIGFVLFCFVLCRIFAEFSIHFIHIFLAVEWSNVVNLVGHLASSCFTIDYFNSLCFSFKMQSACSLDLENEPIWKLGKHRILYCCLAILEEECIRVLYFLVFSYLPCKLGQQMIEVFYQD